MTTATSPTRRRLDRTMVVAAARDLLDEHGVEGFSMSRLGERLGVTAMALYRHVADRLDLEHAVVELVLRDLTTGGAGEIDWTERVAAWMHGVREHWRRHPWLGGLLGDRTELSPPWLRALDDLARVLGEAGLPPETVARELVRISRATAGTIVLEIGAPLEAAAGARMLDALPAADRRRWRPIVRHLARYGDDELFADIVAETVARLRSRVADPANRR